MGSLLLVFIVLALILYLIFFWLPREETGSASATLAGAKNGVTDAGPVTGNRLADERCWYGITFHGFQDEYRFETRGTVQDALKTAREFFLGRNARILSEDSYHLRFWKGRSIIAAYLSGLDTWFPQELDISFQTGPESTLVLLRYNVPGFHIRVPPNQLRREVLELQSTLEVAGAERLAAAPSAGPAGPPGQIERQ